MPSRVAQIAGRLVETGWLASVIAIPLFFNVWSNRVFEPDKLALLRTLALVMVAAGLAVRIEMGGFKRAQLANWLRTPLVLPVLILTGVYAFSTVTSVVPFMSLTGGYQRLQGLYSWLAYVVLFLAIVSLLRRRDQLDRLIYALILPSLPIGLYGVVQKFGREIMPWQGDTTERIASTMGNSIFVAAYLILVVPLTVVRLTEALRDLDRHEGNNAVLRVSAYLVVLAIQVLAIVFSQSRGPLLGLMGGLFFLGLLMASLRASRRAMLSVIGVGAVLAAFLVVFNIPSSPLAPLRDVPYVGRLGRILETDRGTGRVRVLIWEGAVDLITADPVRTVIGWGPESMHAVYTPYYRPELGDLESRNASPDRSHNETFDALVTTGVVGLLAYLLLFTSLFYYGLKWLGLVEGRSSGRLFLGLWIGGGALSAAAFQLWSGSGTYFGVALPAGMIAGLFAFVAVRALQSWTPPERGGQLLVAGLMAGLIAHFIEIHFGIAIASTRTLFFAMAGMLVAVGWVAQREPELIAERAFAQAAAPAPVRRRKRSGRSEPVHAPAAATWTSHGFLMLVVMLVLAWDFIVWTTLTEETQRVAILVWLFTMTWGFGTLVLATETLVIPGSSRSGLGRYVGISLGGFAIYGFAHWSLLVGGSGGGASTSSTLLILFYGSLLALVVAWAAVLAAGDDSRVPVSVRPSFVAVALVLGAIVVAFFTNVNEVRADVYYKQAWVQFHGAATDAVSRGQYDEADRYYDLAIQTYDKALSMDGREDYYMLFKGKGLLERADALAAALDQQFAQAGMDKGTSEYEAPDLAAQVQERDAAFESALTQLREAQAAAPLNTDHTANLARAYQIWADRTLDTARRQERFEQARAYFREAIALSPGNAGLEDEFAMTEYLSGDQVAAREHISAALAIDPEYGRPARLLAIMAREAEDWEAAATHYERYLESRDGRSDPGGWSGYAFVLGRLDRPEDAIVANEKVIALLGRDDPDTLRNLVLLNDQVGDRLGACSYLERLTLVSDESGLADLAARLDCGGAQTAPAGVEPPGVVAPSGAGAAPGVVGTAGVRVPAEGAAEGATQSATVPAGAAATGEPAVGPPAPAPPATSP